MPHVGIVTDASEWKRLERFQCVEAQVDNTVKIVTRGKYETVGFGRPDFKARPGRKAGVQTGSVFVIDKNVRPGSRGRDVMNVQLALVKVAGLKNHSPGVFDSETQRAFVRFQQIIGIVGSDANGIPNVYTLRRLGEISKIFEIHPEL